MSISYSAPAVVALSGFPAYSHGKPTLISAINLRLIFTIKPSNQPDSLHPAFNTVNTIEQTVLYYLKQTGEKAVSKPYSIHISSTIPESQGCGSSSALCVAAVSAFIEYYTGKKPEEFGLEELVNLAFQCSGNIKSVNTKAHIMACVFGGLSFTRKEFTFLSSANILPFSIPKTIQNNFFLIHAGDRQESGVELVNFVQNQLEKDPSGVKKTFIDLDRTTKQLAESLHDDQPSLLKISIRRNHNLMVKLGVISEKSAGFIRQLQDFGEASIIGMGGVQRGSGFALLYTELERQPKLKRFLDSQGYLYIPFVESATGILQEEVA